MDSNSDTPDRREAIIKRLEQEKAGLEALQDEALMLVPQEMLHLIKTGSAEEFSRVYEKLNAQNDAALDDLTALLDSHEPPPSAN